MGVFGDGFVYATGVEESGAGLKLLTFPDGFRCYSHSSPEEAMLIYNEIFVQQEYLGTSISLDDCRCLFDVGANIGLFTIFAKRKNPDIVVHAFEPIKATYDVLAKNIELHALKDVHLYNCAVGAIDAERVITFYPNLAGNSTAHPETKVVEQRVLAALIGEEQTRYLYQSPQEHTVPVSTLSSFIEQKAITRVDLLKIDTEGDELEVLRGITDTHYPLISQITIEVHSDDLLAQVQSLLAKKGFCVSAVAGMAIGHTVFAVRS